MSADLWPLVGGGARWVLFASLLTMVGSCSVRALMGRVHARHRVGYLAAGHAPGARSRVDGHSPVPPPVPREWQGIPARLGLVAAFLGLSAQLALFAVQLADFRDPFSPLRDDAALLLSSFWGTAWLLGIGGSAAATALFGLMVRATRAEVHPPQPAPQPALPPSPQNSESPSGAPVERRLARIWWLAALVSCALTLQPGLTGHAMNGPLPWSWLADGVHLLAAGAWVGSLPVLLLVLRRSSQTPATAHDPASSPAVALLMGFSPIALTAAGIVGLSGLARAWWLLDSPAQLVGTPYGRILLGKLVLVAAIMALGAWNWRRNVPAFARDGTAPPLQRDALLEAFVVQAVLVVTAWLVHTPPPSVM